MEVNINNQMRTQAALNCYLCGSKGILLYRDLKDRLFDVPGAWSLKRCSNLECGLIWLDPLPIEEDIDKAYRTYYTHIREKNKRSFIWNLLNRTYQLFLCATPIYWERKRLNLMYLDKVSPGRLLEIGCGDGKRLAEFQAKGWKVEGQDIDPKATVFCWNDDDFKVHLGAIEQLAFLESQFDAVIMNHVIEHVHDPTTLLKNCRHLLKPRGVLVVVTPNIDSYGHTKFQAYWRGLEPPRHIHLFNCRTLLQVAKKAGFDQYDSWTTAANAEHIAAGSLDIQVSKQPKTTFRYKLNKICFVIKFQLLARIVWSSRKYSGEECILRAVK